MDDELPAVVRCDASVSSEAADHARRPAPATGGTLAWLGHSTALVELDGVRLLTDPVLRDRIGHLVRIAPARPRAADVGVVDCVLLSHLHADHADIPTLRAVARTGPIVAPAPARTWLTDRGFGSVDEVSAGDVTAIGPVEVAAVPAVHDGRRWPRGPAPDPIGFLIRGSVSIYFAGDTDLFPQMEDLRGSVDVALLPVWGWGRGIGHGHLDPERAAAAAALIQPAVAIPIHWGTFALPRAIRGSADPVEPARTFALLVARRAPGVEVRLLAPGATTEL
jgi:L-ascorbate metabolism protein UlaG (beta-lactamase superfamily)